jgi:hypothetical protein
MQSTTFLDKCKGIALIIFATAALMYSINPVQADTPQASYAAGRYQMNLNSVDTQGSGTYFYILVWDTETGRSKMYYGSTNSKKIGPAYQTYQLPSSPL